MENKAQNYTPEQTQLIVEQYQQGTPVEQIAQAVGKSTRSIVAKLSREGVYVAKTKQSAPRVKKSELVERIAQSVGVPSELFESLEKANHEVLEQLAQKLGVQVKIVINTDYGGFSLSLLAREYIANLKGWTLVESTTYENMAWWEPPINSIEHNVFGDQVWDQDLPRTDPHLIQCVEELGDSSWGIYAELKVVEVPDSVSWHIQETDGREWVAEDHRTWM